MYKDWGDCKVSSAKIEHVDTWKSEERQGHHGQNCIAERLVAFTYGMYFAFSCYMCWIKTQMNKCSTILLPAETESQGLGLPSCRKTV